MKNLLKKILINFITEIINLNLFFLKKKKYYYSDNNSFGDTFEYYLKYFNKFKKNKILVFSKTDKNIVEFIYGKDKITKILSYIYFFPTYEVFRKLKNKKNFIPYKKNYQDRWDHLIRKKDLSSCRSILRNKILSNKKKITDNLIKFKKEKYILIHVKHYSDEVDNLNFANSRQTCDLKKVFNVINIIRKKYKIIILGVKEDKSLKILKDNLQNKKNIYFFYDLSKNYSIQDQMFCYYYSLGYIGSAAGMMPILWVLNKKIIVFDLTKDKIDERFISKNFSFLFKRYLLRKSKKIKILDENIVEKIRTNNIEKKNLQILEVSSNEIIKEFKKFF